MSEMTANKGSAAPQKAEEALIDMTLDSWRFAKLFSRLITKLEPEEAGRYIGQYRYYVKRLTERLEQINMRLVSVEGQLYDTGMAVTALNVGDFDPDERLVVDQMVEPIIMGDETLVRPGTVTLKKVEL